MGVSEQQRRVELCFLSELARGPRDCFSCYTAVRAGGFEMPKHQAFWGMNRLMRQGLVIPAWPAKVEEIVGRGKGRIRHYRITEAGLVELERRRDELRALLRFGERPGWAWKVA